MTTMRRKIDELKKKDMDVSVSYIEHYDTNFMSFILDMDNALGNYREISQNLYIYFEKNSNNKNILCFKLKEDKGFVVFSSNTIMKKGIPKTYVRIEKIDGQTGFEIAKKVAPSIITFFQNAAMSANDLEPNTKVVYFVDFRTRKVRVTKKKHIEKTLDMKHKKVG